MEASSAVLRQIPYLSSAGVDTYRRFSPSSANSSVKFRALSLSKVRLRSSCNGFEDKGHMVYYNVSEKSGEKEIKKKLKILKGLTKDLTMYSDLGFVEDARSNSIGEDQGKVIKEAKEVLMNQLEKLKSEEKEMKRKRKMEKAKLKEQRMETMAACESSSSSSSSSSESSDSESGEVIDMNRLRNNKPLPQPMLDGSSFTIEAAATTSTLTVSPTQEGLCSSSTSSVSFNEGSKPVIATSGKRIEVCMGKKCSKSGGAALLEEFERVVGFEGAVVGCKCMGKCKDGPNVRVLNSVETIQEEGLDVSIRSVANTPLCIGVGLEDVGVIVANLFGKDANEEALGPTLAA